MIKMLLKAFFDKTAFVKFRIITIYKTLMEYIQNNQKAIENPYQPMDIKNL